MVKFDVATGAQVKAKAGAPAYTKVFANALIKEAEKDDRIVAITAAMPAGTGLDLFGERFPVRTFDVGIALEMVSMRSADHEEARAAFRDKRPPRFTGR